MVDTIKLKRMSNRLISAQTSIVLTNNKQSNTIHPCAKVASAATIGSAFLFFWPLLFFFA
jgi:hypothetical protein